LGRRVIAFDVEVELAALFQQVAEKVVEPVGGVDALAAADPGRVFPPVALAIEIAHTPGLGTEANSASPDPHLDDSRLPSTKSRIPVRV
jgi:hypothetical protein